MAYGWPHQVVFPAVSARRSCDLHRESAKSWIARIMTTTRRLAATLAADVLGYSRLTGLTRKAPTNN